MQKRKREAVKKPPLQRREHIIGDLIDEMKETFEPVIEPLNQVLDAVSGDNSARSDIIRCIYLAAVGTVAEAIDGHKYSGIEILNNRKFPDAIPQCLVVEDESLYSPITVESGDDLSDHEEADTRCEEECEEESGEEGEEVESSTEPPAKRSVVQDIKAASITAQPSTTAEKKTK